MTSSTFRNLRFLGPLSIVAACTVASLVALAGPERRANGIALAVDGGWLAIDVCADDVVRIAYGRDRAFLDRQSVITAPKECGGAKWEVAERAGTTSVTTARLEVRVDTASGAVSFFDWDGRLVLAERAGGRTLTPAEVQGERVFHVRQQWEPREDESLYGLGQHQLGLMDIKGYDLDLWQHNVTVSVPVLVSSAGYGILWDNLSLTRFGDLREAESIPPSMLRDRSGRAGGLTGSYYAGANFERLVATRVDDRIAISIPGGTPQANRKIHPDLPADGDISVRWEGQVVPDESGDYLFETFSQAGIRMWLDDRLVIDHWRQGWLPWKDVARARLEAGRSYRLRLEWSKDQGNEEMHLRWKTPSKDRSTSLWSEVGDGIEYYFLYGPELDRVVAGYRRLTGQAPLMPRWAFGLWQSRERYRTGQEVLDVLDGFRSRRIPLDAIVQDWQYWKLDSWGSHEFDPGRFPDPDAWLRTIHDKYHARLMISVWPKFYPGTANFEAMRQRGYLFESVLKAGMKDWLGFPYTFYDAFNEGARRLFWEQIDRALFRKGIDAWWMDATEPDLVQPVETLEGQRELAHPTALGTGARVLNAYSLYNSMGIYEGQRGVRPDQRVFILTRSGFAGQQRYAAATWSGDVTSTWTAFRKQIPAGLSFSLSGLPYWTMDVGGFAVPPRFAKEKQAPEDAAEWQEMNARWFQYGTFTPLLRVHGQFPYREMWFLGGESSAAYQTQLKFDRLRYRLLPYVYSIAGAATHEAGTMMRPLVMDFRQAPRVRNIGDQYMFGPAFLVCPVTVYKARARSVYLPAGATWFDFWTGRATEGGHDLDAAAPLDSMPLFVRAGSIVPIGPELQYTDERPADPITLYVYTGADGRFTLYEDEGTNYGYERGAFARVPFTWDQAAGTLTIGAREGSFPGMLGTRTFDVVFVSSDAPVGFSFDPKPHQTVKYTGASVTVRPQ